MILEAIGGPRDGERLRVPIGDDFVDVGAAPTGHLIGVQQEARYRVKWQQAGHNAPRVLVFDDFIEPREP